MALQAEINNLNFLVEENGDIATVRSKNHIDSQVSFYIFDDKIVNKINDFKSKSKGLSVEEILNEYGLAIPSEVILDRSEKSM